jgi:hypothetical protein
MVAARDTRRPGPRLTALWGAALAVACNALVGIEDPVIIDAGSAECILNSDCPNQGDVCIFGTCSLPCNADRDCPEDARCLVTAAGTACVEGSAARCTKDSCPDGSICADGVCRNDCSNDAEVCLKDQVCDEDGVCRGTDPAHDSLSDQGQAGSGTTDHTGGAGGAQNHASGGPAEAGVGGSSATGGEQGRLTGGAAGTEPGVAGSSGALELGGASGSGGALETGGQAGGGGASQSGGQAGSSGAAGSPFVPECETEGLVTCVDRAATGRRRCEQGQWRPFTPCSDGELCDNEAEQSGACAPVPEECRGRQPNEVFCQGATRIECGPDLVTVDSEQCASVQHCALGTGSACAACLPNEHRCVDDLLQVCNAERTGFDDVTRCTDDPCNAGAGACTTLVCLESGALRCFGDRLESCNDARDGFDLVELCGEGLCDSEDLECDVCLASTAACDPPSTRLTCSEDGQRETESACPASAPFCTNAGRCVECTQGAQCAAPNDCFIPACNTGTGACELNFRGAGATCEGGYCNAAEQCVECLQPEHCGVTGDCYLPTCDSNACGQEPKDENEACEGGVCDGSGQCVECNQAAQCASVGECYTKTCGNHTCGADPRGAGQPCTGGVCDGDGSCVECTQPSQCEAANDCYNPTCSSGHNCGQQPKNPGQPCSDGVCDGDGSCVECTQASHCPSGNECQTAACLVTHTCTLDPRGAGTTCTDGVCDGDSHCVECVDADDCGTDQICRDFACVDAYHTVGWEDATSTTASLLADVLYLKRLPARAYDAELVAFDIVGTAGGASAKLALYEDNGSGTGPRGGPLAQTQNPIVLIDGPRSMAALPTSYVLQAETTYWLAVKLNGATSLRAGSSTVTGRQVVYPPYYVDPFQDFPGAANPGASHTAELALYLEVMDIE